MSTESKQTTVPLIQRLRWKTALSIPIVGLLVQWFFWNLWEGDYTHQVFSGYFIWPTVAFLLLLWWMFLSGVKLRSRIYGVISVAIAVISFLVLFRVTFDGAMVPQFSLRWNLFGLGGEEPDWTNDSPDNRSAESYAMEHRLKKEAGRFEHLKNELAKGNRSVFAKIAKTDNFTPAEILRANGEKNWEQWQTVDGLAIGLGCSFRAVYRPNDPPNISGGWPRFRGPRADSTIRDASIKTEFNSADPPETLWETDQRVGDAWSSFAVVEGLAFTMEQRGEEETTVCYDFSNGSQIWSKSDDVHFQSTLGGNGPRSTPTVYAGRLYTLGATGILNCRDVLTGDLFWTRNILEDAEATNLQWGMSGSPLVAGNLVFVNAGIDPDASGKSNKAVIAYNRFTGKIVWSAGNEVASYSTPVFAKIHGIDQLLIYNGEGLFAYNPSTGEELWKYDNWTNQPKVNAAQPIVHDNHVFISSGYSTGSALLKIDVADGKWSVTEKWVRKNRFRLKFNDGILKDGYVYGLDEKILSCIEWKTGKTRWKIRGKYGYGQMLLVGDNLLITAESGMVHLIPATPNRPKELTQFPALNRHVGTLERKGMGWNHAVFVNGKLLVRNNREVACYDIGLKRKK
ncbi:MAG: hypothetical protein Tsb009_34460 [Planctomycetaceae bacterium]